MKNSQLYTILTAAAATGAGNSIFVRDFKNIILALDSASSANMTIKIQGSISEDAPDFGAAQSTSNQWDYVQTIDIQDGASIDGDTGVILTGTDDHRQLEANINGLNWVTVNITARSAGSLTAKATIYNDA